MPENTENTAKTPAAPSHHKAAQASDTKAEATGTASDELSEDDLEAVAGGRAAHYSVNPTDKPVRIGPSHYDKPNLPL